MIYVLLAVSAAAVGLFMLMRRDAFKRGEDKIEKAIMREVLDDVHTAKLAKDALNANPNSPAALRLRKKYTRPIILPPL